MFREVYRRLYRHYGPQGWWPGNGPFDVMVGAVLTQNTAWRNVDRALGRLRNAGLMAPAAMADAAVDRLAEATRPSGYFNVKARRLQALCRAYLAWGGHQGMARLDTGDLRRVLLGVHGVGRETADDILVYAFDRPVFVVDAYTRRIFERLALLDGGEHYDTIRRNVEAALDPDPQLFNEYHALIVRLGNAVCRPRPECGACVLRDLCPTAGRSGPDS